MVYIAPLGLKNTRIRKKRIRHIFKKNSNNIIQEQKVRFNDEIPNPIRKNDFDDDSRSVLFLSILFTIATEKQFFTFSVNKSIKNMQCVTKIIFLIMNISCK